MKDEQIFDLLVDTNPVPNPDGLDSPLAFSDFTIRRGVDMQTQQKKRPTHVETGRRNIFVAAAAFLVLIAAGIGIFLATSSSDDGLDAAAAENRAVEFGERISAGDVGGAADLFSADWDRLGIPLTEGSFGVVPPGSRTGILRVNTPLRDGLEFIAAWVDLDMRECNAEAVSEVRTMVRCTAVMSGPMPQALDLPPVDVPVVFGVDEQGFVDFGLDFTVVNSPGYEFDGDLVPTLAAFNRYAADDSEFASRFQRGIGKPVISVASAAAHIELAEQWVAAGKP